MATTSTPRTPTKKTVSADVEKHLSQHELHQLTLFKWRYTFEGLGFNPYQARELAFLTWLRASRRVTP